MRHVRKHAEARNREHRQRLAHEAARLMCETGALDFHQAKMKAAQRLGLHDEASLPSNDEIEQALREYQRLFAGDAQLHALRQRREAALRGLEFFVAFQPRLVGPVLEGLADASSPVQLHLHSDHAEAVAFFLEENRVPVQARSRRLRLDRQRHVEAQVLEFSAEGLDFELWVLPLRVIRHAPLSNVTDKPMKRASAAQLRLLLDGEEATGSTRIHREERN